MQAKDGEDMKHKLTGEKRYRAQHRLFKTDLVVLQVEVNKKGWYTALVGGVVDTVDVDENYWRDARVRDITTGKL